MRKVKIRLDRAYSLNTDEQVIIMNESKYELVLDPTLDPRPVSPALIWAEQITMSDSESAFEDLEKILDHVATTGEEAVPTEVRKRVRAILRHGKYKPSGRGKPASEFLLKAALGGDFPLINGPVDVNNTISLESGFPASIFDAERSGRRLRLRRGIEGESYVFNPSGQLIDLQDLLVVCREDDVPCGNPVKDSMDTKTHDGTCDVIAVLYAPADEPEESVRRWAERFAELLGLHCHAARTGVLLPD